MNPVVPGLHLAVGTPVDFLELYCLEAVLIPKCEQSVHFSHGELAWVSRNDGMHAH